jgi:hypothetical protein
MCGDGWIWFVWVRVLYVCVLEVWFGEREDRGFGKRGREIYRGGEWGH